VEIFWIIYLAWIVQNIQEISKSEYPGNIQDQISKEYPNSIQQG
jgi:hypothetical protein